MIMCRYFTLNEPDNKGFTPLHYAVKQNDAEFVKCLVANGAGELAWHELVACTFGSISVSEVTSFS
jgi:ankyrin repeat protein